MRALVLFGRDLRVHDHPALHEACRRSREVLPVFVLDPHLRSISPNRDRFLLEGLHDLDRNLRRRSGRLIVATGDPAHRALELARAAGCDAIYATADVTPIARARERALASGAASLGIAFRLVAGNTVIEPGEVAPSGASTCRVFSPYQRA